MSKFNMLRSSCCMIWLKLQALYVGTRCFQRASSTMPRCCQRTGCKVRLSRARLREGVRFCKKHSSGSSFARGRPAVPASRRAFTLTSGCCRKASCSVRLSRARLRAGMRYCKKHGPLLQLGRPSSSKAPRPPASWQPLSFKAFIAERRRVRYRRHVLKRRTKLSKDWVISRQFLDNVDREHNVVTMELRGHGKALSDLQKVQLAIGLRFTQSRRGAAPVLARALRSGKFTKVLAQIPCGQAYRSVLRQHVLAQRVEEAAASILRQCPFADLHACAKAVSTALANTGRKLRCEFRFHSDEVAADLAGWRRAAGSPFVLDRSNRYLGPGAKKGLKRDGVFASGTWPPLDKRLKGEELYLAASQALAAELGEPQPTMEVALCTYESYRAVETRGITQPFAPGKGRPSAPALNHAGAWS